MKKTILTALIFLCVSIYTEAQFSRYVVQFTDKKGTAFSIANPAGFLSQAAIQRRIRQQIAIDSSDLPISQIYLDSIRNVANVTVINKSKWFNQVLIRTSDANAIAKINSFPFVKSTNPIASVARPVNSELINQKFKEPVRNLSPSEVLSGANGMQGPAGPLLNYGSSFNQIHLHEGEFLHDMGFTGAGITIAILDAGFYGYKTNSAMDSTRLQGRILGEWDYVLNEQSVNEDHPHGLYCFSIIAANKPGQVMGSAPHAKFYLLRTEDAATEYPVEEQNWVAAAEFADSAGVDMITSSLGYAEFDNPIFNHSYAQRNGNTTLITNGADLAVKKGMIVTNSAGNSGGSPGEAKYIACPADGDSVFTVGATTSTGVIAGFSSWGPNSAGKVKPNIVSVGQGTVLANTSGNPSSGNGTSFSNPLACGLIACLWQAFPEFSNMEITQAVMKSSDRFNTPDDRYGYGIPNFRLAYELLSKERDLKNLNSILGNNWLKAYPNPSNQQQSFRIAFKAPLDGVAVFQLLNSQGQLVDAKSMNITNGQLHLIDFTNTQKLTRGVYFVRYSDGKNKQTIKVVKQ